MTTTPHVRPTAALLAFVLVVAVSGCTADPVGQPTSPSDPSASSAPTLTVRPGVLKVRLAPVRGPLGDRARTDLRRGVASVIGAWMTDGFAAPSPPRSDYSDAFASYTPRAVRLAREQRAVTTNAQLGSELVEVVPTQRVARVAVLAAGGRAVGASAEVLLVIVGARQDGSQVELVVRGTLRLTPTPKGWKVFGFDLSRSVGAPGAHAASARRDRARADDRDHDGGVR